MSKGSGRKRPSPPSAKAAAKRSTKKPSGAAGKKKPGLPATGRPKRAAASASAALDAALRRVIVPVGAVYTVISPPRIIIDAAVAVAENLGRLLTFSDATSPEALQSAGGARSVARIPEVFCAIVDELMADRAAVSTHRKHLPDLVREVGALVESDLPEIRVDAVRAAVRRWLLDRKTPAAERSPRNAGRHPRL